MLIWNVEPRLAYVTPLNEIIFQVISFYEDRFLEAAFYLMQIDMEWNNKQR